VFLAGPEHTALRLVVYDSALTMKNRSHVPALMLILASASTAAAQTAAPSSAPTPPVLRSPNDDLVAPVAETSAPIPYPNGGTGDETVTLTLTIDAHGNVTEATPSEGAREPFAAAAVEAVRTYHFRPATRAEHPVAAKIRFEVAFHAPVVAAPTEAQVAPLAPGVTAVDAAPAQAIEDVNVRGDKVEAAPAVTLSRAEVRQLPGAFGDPFRAIEALPGVTPIVSGLPFFYVRGAPPGNTGYFIDQIRVPYLFHAGAGPSVIHPGMVERVDLYPGAAPARYGRFSGGIVTAETTAPRTDFHGEGNLRLFDAGAMAETGFANGKGTALVGGRYSYTAAILSLIAKDTDLAYRDYQARVSYDLTPQDRLSLVSFGSYDLVAQTLNGIYTVLFASEFYRADLRYDKRIDADTTLRAAVTFGFDQSRIPDQPRNSKNASVAARVLADHRVSQAVTLRGGADVSVENLSANARPYSDPDDPTTQRFNALFPPRTDVNTGAWFDAVLKLGIWELTPGARLDLYTSAGASAVAIDPRVASRIKVANKVHVIHTLGLAHQPPSFVIPVPGLAIGSLQGGLQDTIQASAGVEVALPYEFVGTVTAFENIFENMSDTLGASPQGGGGNPLNFREPRSQGSAVGGEFYLKRRLSKHIGGYLSYTLSRSLRTVGTERFLSAFDRPHVGSAAISLDLGRNWRGGVRFLAYSGAPVQPPGGRGLIPPPRSLTPDRDPAFYRLDARIEKKWQFGKTAWLSFVAEMMNVTLHKETLLGREIGPISIPSIGLEGAL
jgi:TonB-dependent Receptor Plug Domain/Gram-negative bacterial TonB protein C-terminal